MTGKALELQGFQKKHLRGLAHTLEPVVQVGKDGVTGAVARAVDEALTTHELIKVRLLKPEDKKSFAQELAAQAGACLCALVGHTVILYRPHPEKPVIRVPKRHKP